MEMVGEVGAVGAKGGCGFWASIDRIGMRDRHGGGLGASFALMLGGCCWFSYAEFLCVYYRRRGTYITV